MQIKIFTLRYSDDLNGFDDTPMRTFMNDKEIISIKEEFFIQNNVPHWAVMLFYKPGIPGPDHEKDKASQQEQKKDEYRKILTNQSMPLFNFLREWRNQRARKETVPEYVVFKNIQIAEIAVREPESLNRMAEIVGIARCGKNSFTEINPCS